MKIAVLGCGYVGLELCRLLSGHDVIGVRRSKQGIEAIEATGTQAVMADITDETTLSAVPDVDAIVFSASSGGRDAAAARSVYVEGLQTVIDQFGARDDSPDQLVYTSSTGVYGDHDGGWVDEETPIEPTTESSEGRENQRFSRTRQAVGRGPTTEKTRVLAEAERVAHEHASERGIEETVVRFAGLYGPDRYRLDRYLDGPVTEGYLNMIHRADAAGVLGFALTEQTDKTLLAVDDEPVDKWEFAAWLAAQCGVETPPLQTKTERLEAGNLSTPAKRRILTSKRCSNDRLRELGYEFEHPTFRTGYRDAIERYRTER